jgi:hypothetical protein
MWWTFIIKGLRVSKFVDLVLLNCKELRDFWIWRPLSWLKSFHFWIWHPSAVRNYEISGIGTPFHDSRVRNLWIQHPLSWLNSFEVLGFGASQRTVRKY